MRGVSDPVILPGQQPPGSAKTAIEIVTPPDGSGTCQTLASYLSTQTFPTFADSIAVEVDVALREWRLSRAGAARLRVLGWPRLATSAVATLNGKKGFGVLACVRAMDG